MKNVKRILSYTFITLLFIVGICSAQNRNSADERTLSLSCNNADIVDVLRGIAIEYQANIVPDNSVSGKVTIYLDNAPFEAGLRTLLETNGFTYEKQGDIYLVNKKAPTIENLQITVSSDGLLTIDARGADVKEVIRQLSTRMGINIVAESNLTGTITAHLSDVPIDDALAALFSENNFTLYENSGIYHVGSRMSRQSSSFVIFKNKDLLTIDVKNAPVVDVLQDLATQTKINLVTAGNLAGNVTARLENVTLEQALEMITTSSGTAYKKIDDIYIVGDVMVKPGQENPLLERKVIRLKYIEVDDMINILPPDLRNNVTFSPVHNAIIILGTPKTIEHVEKLMEELDVADDELRSRQQFAIWVEVDEDGLISVDAKDAPMELVVREISIKTGIDVTIIESTGGSTVARRITQQRPEVEAETARETARLTARRAAQAAARQPQAAISRSGLSGNVNLRIKKATLDEVFDALFSGTEYTYRQKQYGDKVFYLVGTGDLDIDRINPLIVSQKIPLNYLDATQIIELLPTTIPDDNIIVIPDQNAIAVIGTPEMIDFLSDYLSKIDSPTPQVMIEALLLELTRGSTKDLGIEWSASKDKSFLEVAEGVSLVFDSLEKVPDAFDVSLNALLAENKARILSSPRVAVLSGQQALIDVGVKYMFQSPITIYGGGYGLPVEETVTGRTRTEISATQRSQSTTLYQPGGYTRSNFNTIDTGIILDITPWVNNVGEITMTISPKILDADMVTVEESRVAQRTIDTVIRVKDGGMIVIGGLIQKKSLTSEDKVPILGSIPLMGRLFSTSHKVENESELIIVIKPRIIQSVMKEREEDVQK
ncbi:hypothetical protein FJZ31_19900 [Candidatus Poribacteria bacterium]|nr:hypothetical protein [Candidatus Poribacteria bacterium]